MWLPCSPPAPMLQAHLLPAFSCSSLTHNSLLLLKHSSRIPAVGQCLQQLFYLRDNSPVSPVAGPLTFFILFRTLSQRAQFRIFVPFPDYYAKFFYVLFSKYVTDLFVNCSCSFATFCFLPSFSTLPLPFRPLTLFRRGRLLNLSFLFLLRL